MLIEGQRIKWRRNIADNFNYLSRVHKRHRKTDRRQTDGWAMTYSERKRKRSLKNQSLTVFIIYANQKQTWPITIHRSPCYTTAEKISTVTHLALNATAVTCNWQMLMFIIA